MKYGVYVITDNGVESSSLPFFAQSEVIARRSFAQSMRQVPPSARCDFALQHIAQYDDEQYYFDPLPVVNTIATGADDDVNAVIMADADFYRVGVDQLPVSTPAKED